MHAVSAEERDPMPPGNPQFVSPCMDWKDGGIVIFADCLANRHHGLVVCGCALSLHFERYIYRRVAPPFPQIIMERITN